MKSSGSYTQQQKTTPDPCMRSLTSCHGTTFSGNHGYSCAAHLSFSLATVTMIQKGACWRSIQDKQAAIPFQILEQESVGSCLEPLWYQTSECFVMQEHLSSNASLQKRISVKKMFQEKEGKPHLFCLYNTRISMEHMLSSSSTNGQAVDIFQMR